MICEKNRTVNVSGVSSIARGPSLLMLINSLSYSVGTSVFPELPSAYMSESNTWLNPVYSKI